MPWHLKPVCQSVRFSPCRVREIEAACCRLNIVRCFGNQGHVTHKTAALVARVVGYAYDRERHVHSVWNPVVNRETPYSLDGQEAADTDACSVCKDLLANMQRFFDMLENARQSSTSEWMTVEEVARELKISKSIVYRIIRSGDLAAVDIVDANGHIARKGHYRIRRSSLKDYLESKRVRPLRNQTVQSRPRRYPRVKNHLGV
jgi:hypothetical protein